MIMKRLTIWLLAAALVFAMIPAVAVISSAAEPATDVPYIERSWDAATETVKETVKTAENCTVVDGGTTAWGSAGETTWYVVSGSLEVSERITVTGDVRLILCDGTTLKANAGITVSGASNSLTVYGQSKDAAMGALVANAENVDYSAGIGGQGEGGSGGTVTINGGVVTAQGGVNGAGIGGGDGGDGGTVTV